MQSEITVAPFALSALEINAAWLADGLHRQADLARLYATGDVGEEIPPVVREYIEGLPETFRRLMGFVDNELLKSAQD